MPRRRAEKNDQPDENPQAGLDSKKFLELATSVAAAYVSNNHVRPAEIPSLINGIHASISQLDSGMTEAVSKPPAIAIKRSIGDDYIICLEDGKKLRTLKRYLRTQYDLTPEQYRAKWSLPHDYPMVAPSYAKLRSEFAKKIGLGRKPGEVKRGKRKTA